MKRTEKALCKEGYSTPQNYAGYNLVWQDEFEGATLNTDNWTHAVGGHGWGNKELQYYTDSINNAYLKNGHLVIEAKKEIFKDRNYTSARLITQHKQSFQFGRVDIRAILPEGQGIWPALWMLGSNYSDIGWPACGEIDIMELLGHEPLIVHATGHWGIPKQGSSYRLNSTYDLKAEKFSEQFHVFSMIWKENSIRWYVDDQEFFSLKNTDVNGNYPFNAPFFFLINIAVGGKWPGPPDTLTIFPQRMYVDYIRVFQKKEPVNNK